MSTRPRRLALVITELEPGGAERMLVELATRIDRNKFEPLVYSLSAEPPTDRSQLAARLITAGILTQYLGLRSATQYFTAVRSLADLFLRDQIDLVQSFLFHANVIASRAALLAGIRPVCTGIRVADPRRWRILVERLATARADRFVCVSQSVAEFVRRRGFQSEKLTVIPNGVDLPKWRDAQPIARSSLGVRPGRRALLYVGRLDKQKGLDRFFDELPHLFRDLPELELVLAGDGPLRTNLERSAQHHGIQDHVRFVGWRTDIPAILKASDLLVLPSRWEGMPNVVLEAMAAGKPVVATQSEGTVELLGLGAMQQTVPLGDWTGLRERIVELALDSQLAAKVGLQNQLRAEQFSLERVAERYERLYEGLVQEKTAAF